MAACTAGTANDFVRFAAYIRLAYAVLEYEDIAVPDGLEFFSAKSFALSKCLRCYSQKSCGHRG